MAGLTMERAKELLHSTTTEAHLFEHAIGVSAAMGAMARHFGEDEATGGRWAICTTTITSSTPKSI